MTATVATIAAPAINAAADVAARAAAAVRAIYARTTKTHALLRAARKFHVLAMTAAANGGFWVSAGGGTFRVAAGTIARELGVSFSAAQVALDKTGPEYWGTTQWYRAMADACPGRGQWEPDEFRWDITTVARAAARWAKTHPTDPAPAPAAPIDPAPADPMAEFAIGELRRLCPAGATLYVAAADDTDRPGREWHGSVMAVHDGHVHHLNWLVEDAGIAPRGRLGRLVIRPQAGEDVGERIARIIARVLYPGQDAALRHAWV
jgi:hypothetical protein